MAAGLAHRLLPFRHAARACLAHRGAASTRFSTSAPSSPAASSTHAHPRRLLITGAGAVSALGVGLGPTLAGLAAGRSGVRPAGPADLEGWPGGGESGVWVATVPGDTPPPPHGFANPGAGRCAARFATLAGLAAAEALTAANFPVRPESEAGGGGAAASARLRARTGVALGCGLAGLGDLAGGGASSPPGRPLRLSPYFVPRVLPSMAAGHVSMAAGLGGPAAVPAGGGAAGLDALGAAAALLRSGAADAVVAGGSDAAVDGVTLAGWAGAVGKGGPALGEGAGVVLLEWEGGEGGGRTSRPPALAALLGYGSAWSDTAGLCLAGGPARPAWADDGGGKEGDGLASAVAAAAAAALTSAGAEPSSVGAVITTGPDGDSEAAGARAAGCEAAAAAPWSPVPACGASLAGGGGLGVALAASVLGGPPGPLPPWWPGSYDRASRPLVLVTAACPLGGGVAAVVVGPA